MIFAGVSHFLRRVLFLLWGSHGKQLGLGWHSPKWRVIVILRANKRGANLKSRLYGLNRKCIWTWIWESLFFHRAIFKPWRLTLSRGYFFFPNYKALGFLTGVSTSVSDHMDQRPRRNNVCRVLAQTGISTANTLHPSTLAARLLFTLCSRHMPSEHIIKAEITLWNTIVQPLPCKTRSVPSVYIHQQALHIQHHTALGYFGHRHHCVNWVIATIIPESW